LGGGEGKGGREGGEGRREREREEGGGRKGGKGEGRGRKEGVRREGREGNILDPVAQKSWRRRCLQSAIDVFSY